MQPWTVDIRAKRPNRPVSHQLHFQFQCSMIFQLCQSEYCDE